MSRPAIAGPARAGWRADPAVWESFPYFWAVLLGFTPLALGWAIFPGLARDACLAGLFWLPMAPAAILHSAYWQPQRLAGLSWGIEDILYLFQVSSLAWLLALAWVGRRYRLILPRLINVRRYLGFALCGVGLNLLLTWLGMFVLAALVLVNGLLVGWCLLQRPAYRPLALAGLLTLVPAMCLEQKIWFMIWPDFVAAWNQGVVWGREVWGIPLGEIAFHASFVAATPLGVVYCREGRLERINPPY